jgi:eukaryotic-like serine/threonine-protein kinase
MVTLGDVLVDRYRIDAALGSGGMASVFRAQDLRLGRDVAVKVLLPHLAGDPTVVTRFEREARALAAVRHANVIGVLDVEAADPATGRPPFLVLELADGGTLADRLRATGALDRHELAPVVTAVAAGLDALHATGLVHRDVKPANVLFADGVPKLGDLGIARWADPNAVTTEAAGLTTDGGVLGTLRYLPPEALSGSSPGPAGDVFGLAALAFEALTGRPVRPGSSLATIAADASAMPPAPSEVMPDLGTGFDPLFAAALSADPGVRPDPSTFAARFADAAASPAQAVPQADPDDETVVRAVARPSSMALDPAALAEPLPGPAVRPQARPGPVVRRRSPRATRPPRRSFAVPLLFLGAAALVVMAMVVAFANAGRDPDDTGVLIPTVSPSGSAVISPSPSLSPSPVPSPTPSPAPTPEPTRDPALDAVDAVRAAIAGARGGKDGLKEPEARDLDDRLDAIVVRLTNGDRDEARRLAEDLAKRVDKLDVKGDRGERLTQAVGELVQAIGGD